MFFPYGYYGYGMNGSLLLVLLAAVLGVLAQSAVQKQYKKYSAVHAMSGVTAAQAAQALLSQAGIYDVRIERSGRAGLSDHYDPKTKTLRLSDGVMNSASIAALGVAAHECGHAMQHDQEYLPLRMRNSLVPMVNLASNLSMPLFIIGLLMSFSQLASIGAAL